MPSTTVQEYQRRLSFGHVVRARRTALGLTQQQVAERAGCDRQTIARVETAAHSPSLDRIFTIADALDTTVRALFRDHDGAGRTG
jgi:transcriptional regulator with XRE-family HTH domain